MVPASYISGKEGNMKIRIGLTMATMQVLRKVVRCYWCHEIGHRSKKKLSEVRTPRHVMGSLTCPTCRKLIKKGTVRIQAP